MTTKSNHNVRFSSLFTPEYVICHTQETDRNKLLKEMLEKLAMARGIGNVEQAYKELLERENQAPTVVGPAIAMPHVRLTAIDQIIVGIATSQNGIQYAGSTGMPVKLIILTLAPKAAPGAYLQAMSSLAKICH
ncbi:MAG: PTS sugar transporter subunit IIA, partial [Phycisphaerae bacterium]|nr:PTS sugar transporter subunit IIA [Phycisphaerae bacterium]